jgi:nicotinamidase-related amidase
MTIALVILDMLNDFVDGTLANPAAKHIVDPIADLIAKARQDDGWRVVYANDAHLAGDFEFKVFGEHALAGTHGAAVIDELTPSDGDLVVPKRAYSAFTGTDLAMTCLVHDIDRLVIVGQHTDCCCRHTSYDAFTRGIDVAVVSDATAVFEPFDPDTTAQRQDAALGYLKTFYAADILSADQVF